MADFELLLHTDFGIDASREREVLEALDGLWGGVVDVDQALMNFHFKSFAAGLIDVWGLYYCKAAPLGR